MVEASMVNGDDHHGRHSGGHGVTLEESRCNMNILHMVLACFESKLRETLMLDDHGCKFDLSWVQGSSLGGRSALQAGKRGLLGGKCFVVIGKRFQWGQVHSVVLRRGWGRRGHKLHGLQGGGLDVGHRSGALGLRGERLRAERGRGRGWHNPHLLCAGLAGRGSHNAECSQVRERYT